MITERTTIIDGCDYQYFDSITEICQQNLEDQWVSGDGISIYKRKRQFLIETDRTIPIGLCFPSALAFARKYKACVILRGDCWYGKDIEIHLNDETKQMSDCPHFRSNGSLING